MKYILLRLRRFCAFITGFAFFISGILKLMDPVGSSLVIESYLKFLHIDFLDFASKWLGVTFAMFETVLGTALITGVLRKLVGWASLLLQGFFTVLTLALLVFNPEMDCGCFGEAIHLSHTETFLKNIVLCILLIAAFIPMRNLGRPKKHKYVSFAIVTASVVAFAVYSLLHIPILDFTDFRPSTTLRAASGEDSQTEFEAEFIYEKDGVRQSFTLTDLPDSTWTFISTQTRERERSDKDVTDLSIRTITGTYADSIATEGKVMVVSVYDTDLSRKTVSRASGFIKDAESKGFRIIILASDDGGNVSEMPGEIFYCDRKSLMTLNRSNGGATWFDDGVLVRKWSNRNLPDLQDLSGYAENESREAQIERSTKESIAFQGFLLYVFAVMLLL